MIKIAYLTPQLDLRGTCRAVYDYANYGQKLYNLYPIILTKKNIYDENALQMFNRRFEIYYYDEESNIDEILENQKCDILYVIKYGKKDNLQSHKIFTIIHCVFDMSEPHGDIYAAVSHTLSQKYNNNTFVPHMISLKPNIIQKDMRNKLNIPKDALVFGRHGGMDTFNLSFVHNCIKNIVNNFSNIYFVFVNTFIFYSHPNIIYLSSISDIEIKNSYLQTLDAYIEASNLGHTFGIAILEACINDIPIICYESPDIWNRNHINNLGDKGIYFTNQENLYNILTNFKRNKNINYKKCAYNYTPKKVMSIFYDMFIIPYLHKINI